MSFTLWFTGLSGAGKTTLSRAVAAELSSRGQAFEVLDGDEVRQGLRLNLGYDRAGREANIRILSFIARKLNDNGIACLVAAIAPYAGLRSEARAALPDYVEVFCDCPLETLIERDPKGLYKRAMRGEIERFTGLGDPYEAPLAPEIHLLTGHESVEQSFAKTLAWLEAAGYVQKRAG